MNDIILQKVSFNSKGRRYMPIKNDRRFISNKRKSRKNSFEIKPLISPDPDSGSEDEVTLHDIRHIKHLQKDEHENSTLRRVNKSDSSGKTFENSSKLDPFQHCEFLDLKIEEGDTLQSISIKYQCSVSTFIFAF